jgi:hypothetical protein
MPETLTETTDLIQVEQLNPIALFTEGGLDVVLEEIEERVRNQVPDLETSAGRKAIASLARKVSSSKVVLDDLGKNLVADWKAKSKKVDVERKKARDRLDALRDEARKPLSDWEAEKERIAAEKELARLIDEAWDEALAEWQRHEAIAERERELAEREEAVRKQQEDFERQEADSKRNGKSGRRVSPAKRQRKPIAKRKRLSAKPRRLPSAPNANAWKRRPAPRLRKRRLFGKRNAKQRKRPNARNANDWPLRRSSARSRNALPPTSDTEPGLTTRPSRHCRIYWSRCRTIATASNTLASFSAGFAITTSRM